MKLHWAETAKNDLIAIQKYIAEDNPTAARRWIDLLRKKVRYIVDHPLAGRKVPEYSKEESPFEKKAARRA